MGLLISIPILGVAAVASLQVNNEDRDRKEFFLLSQKIKTVELRIFYKRTNIFLPGSSLLLKLASGKFAHKSIIVTLVTGDMVIIDYELFELYDKNGRKNDFELDKSDLIGQCSPKKNLTLQDIKNKHVCYHLSRYSLLNDDSTDCATTLYNWLRDH
ncbi:hypothetical protein CYY_006568 [Polysphondylium violaceum]|uniref:Transmembrane protein n=1 Tax=Polysphondylium violaceum TaxID=133409 RepID=A0A8J4PQE2_9MYCE|nr:hypothetical protein CYY_006568 [Polysphondylium violaceum]